jgi:3-dehydroquinate synthase
MTTDRVVLRRVLEPVPRVAPTEIVVGRGLADRIPALLDEQVGAPLYAVVSDARVAELYGRDLRDALRDAGADAELLTFPAGESSKTPRRWQDLVEEFGELGLGRDGCVLAMGGGVTGDLAGFAAASYARGIPLVQVPTSLLAMIDAAIGGKTGVDLRAGKNLAGAFHDPVLVIVDPAFLKTLPERELRTGLAEAVKHGAIADADYFAALEDSAAAILRGSESAVDRLVAGSIRIKTDVVDRDARESGERAILNFGHTVGHGIEWVTGYAVPHGQAVAMGVLAEAEIGTRIGVTEPGTADRLRGILQTLGLPVRLPRHVDPPEVIRAARADKKAREGRVRYALIERIGASARTDDGRWTHAVDDADALAALDRLVPVSDRR